MCIEQERLQKLLIDKVCVKDEIEEYRHQCRDDIVIELHEYLREINQEIVRLMAICFPTIAQNPRILQ